MVRFANWFRSAGPEWTAALALSIQALIFALQAAFLGWQAWILRHHAKTLEKNTNIIGRQAETLQQYADVAGKQAETLKLIGHALDQQGKIMADQLKFLETVDAQAERAKVFGVVTSTQEALIALHSRLANVSSATREDHDDIARLFGCVAQAVLKCRTEVLLAKHLSDNEKKHFFLYCEELANLKKSGNMVEDFAHVHALRVKHDWTLFILADNALPNL
jgi:hypothetical protein